MRCTNLVLAVTLAGLLLVIAEDPASAYIDPGTGSYLLQLAIAGIFGGLVVIGAFWKRLKERIAAIFGKRKKE